MNDARLPEAKD